MGLLDVLTGMRNGPRGFGGGGGGMSPITMALLGLLAYKAVKGFGGANQRTRCSPRAAAAQPPRPAGGLDDLLRGGLGGAGLGAGLGGLGAILSNGLGDLLKQFQGAGKGDVANSWVASGENKPIAPADIGKVLTPEQIEFLTERTGLSREELLAGLAEQLPKAVEFADAGGSHSRAPGHEPSGRTQLKEIDMLWIILVGLVADIRPAFCLSAPNNPNGVMLLFIWNRVAASRRLR